MSASMFLATGALSGTRSTVLFENATASDEEIGTISGHFYTFGPVGETAEDYVNRLTIEVMSTLSQYFTAYWDVSDQVAESMADRDAKLARDGYDILIENDPNDGGLPFIPGGPDDPDYNPGFDIRCR